MTSPVKWFHFRTMSKELLEWFMTFSVIEGLKQYPVGLWKADKLKNNSPDILQVSSVYATMGSGLKVPSLRKTGNLLRGILLCRFRLIVISVQTRMYICATLFNYMVNFSTRMDESFHIVMIKTRKANLLTDFSWSVSDNALISHKPQVHYWSVFWVWLFPIVRFSWAGALLDDILAQFRQWSACSSLRTSSQRVPLLDLLLRLGTPRDDIIGVHNAVPWKAARRATCVNKNRRG